MAQVNLNQGLVAYYPFSGNANDISGNNNSPSSNNATLTTDRFGNANSAYLFNGTSSYMRIPNSASINPSNQISLCAWVKVNGYYMGPCHGNSIIMKGDADYLAGNYLLRFDDNAYTNGQNCVNATVDVNHQNFYGVNSNPPPGYVPYVQTGQWMSVVYTYDGTTAKFYVNCELKVTATMNNLNFSNSYDLFLGTMNHPNFPYWFNGVMDEVRIYNRALNNLEVKAYGDCLSITGTNIGNIINTYTPVTAITLDPCKNTLITVEDASTFNVNDTVMIIQMKGAVIDSTNTASFGTITDYKNAGNYEINYVRSKTGNTIELKNLMTRQYDVPNGKVQLIRVPYYQNANITSTLTCLPWDGSKGGVLVLNVQDTIQLSANIDVNGKGFRGGSDPFSNPPSFNCNENQFYYPVNPDLASGKGEGIAEISASKSFGKGALANGGGGGNSHNSGGGGGSNSSTGGFGGYNFEGSPCTSVPFDNRGIGGKTLPYSNAANKIFMGGGGGAGHSNNPEAFQSTGGNGAGIAIIIADKFKPNGFQVFANGNAANACGNASSGCHEGMGGGGAGGTVLAKVNNYIGASLFQIIGGQGGNMTASGFQKVGPGGGGGGGKVWLSNPSLPAGVSVTVSGGASGVCTAYANDPWGSTSGQLGSITYDLSIPVDLVPFKPNIDSVRMKDSATSCNAFDFKGFGYTNTNPIASWQWYFGDGGTANTQNASHTYTPPGPFTVKLVVTDINGCKDSITKVVNTITLNFDFTYQYNACNPLLVQFNGAGTDAQNPYWLFGDGGFASGSVNTSHTYASQGTYLVKYSVKNGNCVDTVSKLIDLTVIQDNIVLTQDTTICYGSTKQLVAVPSANLCWTPTTYLSNPNISNPVTSTPQPITYYYTAEITGNNLVTNGNFNAGNTGFTTQFTYTPPPGGLASQYYVGPSSIAWNPGMANCVDHTTGSGNMIMFNGITTDNMIVWSQSVPLTANTNYLFSAWVESITTPRPAILQFNINGTNIGNIFTASVTNCQWQQFETKWNSGNNTTAVISIVNKNTVFGGNDFALDDISFAQVFIKRDSVKITVDTAKVITNADSPICEGDSLQLNTTGGVTYSWTPATGLSNTTIANPLAFPTATTQYIVTGTNANGCSAKDSVWVTVNPAPLVTTSNDTTICTTGSAQLFASGGTGYSWSPAATLNNSSIPNPVASPSVSTMYYVTVTGANSCRKRDSVNVTVRTPSTFSVNGPDDVCKNGSVQLLASGGDLYTWSPSSSLNNANIANPLATPSATTTYTVQIRDTLCNNTGNLSTTITVLPLPVITATRSNDIDCSVFQSQLSASGGALYSWTPAGTLNDPYIANPIAMPLTTTEYTVTGSDINGCSNSGKVTVKVSPTGKGGYLMPTAFTPNNDGLNDCYGVGLWGTITQIEFSIYNRWGERIFYSTRVGDCWDGRYKGVPQDPDVFVYMIRARTTCQPEVFRKGTFVLIR